MRVLEKSSTLFNYPVILLASLRSLPLLLLTSSVQHFSLLLSYFAWKMCRNRTLDILDLRYRLSFTSYLLGNIHTFV